MIQGVLPLRSDLRVEPMPKEDATRLMVQHHYLRRKAPISFAFALVDSTVRGAVTFGVPASRHALIGACPSSPESVIELNRLWVDDAMPRNTESWFLARALALLAPFIVISYADTARGHMGYVYRAANFFYAGWTDMERATPRFDLACTGHSRNASRLESREGLERVRRKPKMKYWTVTGDRKERRRLKSLCALPRLDWRKAVPAMGTT